MQMDTDRTFGWYDVPCPLFYIRLPSDAVV